MLLREESDAYFKCLRNNRTVMLNMEQSLDVQNLLLTWDQLEVTDRFSGLLFKNKVWLPETCRLQRGLTSSDTTGPSQQHISFIML